jgi:hypothetical protein
VFYGDIDGYTRTVGCDFGIRFVDTVNMYGSGDSEVWGSCCPLMPGIAIAVLF